MITRETSDPLAITHDSVLQGGTLPGEGKGCALNFFRQRTLVHATLRKPTLCDVAGADKVRWSRHHIFAISSSRILTE